jgi:hypothetical protein
MFATLNFGSTTETYKGEFIRLGSGISTKMGSMESRWKIKRILLALLSNGP